MNKNNLIFINNIAMPAPIKMSLYNGSPTPAQIASLTYMANLTTVPKVKSVAPLSAPMIGRIHNAKASCGSCGRK